MVFDLISAKGVFVCLFVRSFLLLSHFYVLFPLIVLHRSSRLFGFVCWLFFAPTKQLLYNQPILKKRLVEDARQFY